MIVAEARYELIKLVDELVLSYSEAIDSNKDNKTKDKELVNELNTQNKLQLEELKDKEKIISGLNKKCHEYECMINKWQDEKIAQEEEKICNDKVSIVVSQANEIEKKDQYIEQLERKINKYENKSKDKGKIKNNIGLVLNVEPIDPEPVVPEPVVPEPVVPEPVVQEPVVQEPVVQEPVVQEVKVEPVKPEPVVQEPVVQEVKVEPVVEPVVPEPVKPEISIEDSDDEPVYKKIKHKNIKYYVIDGKNPQKIYSIIDNNVPGDIMGERVKLDSGKYKYQVYKSII
jgi:hypothetical protein